MRVYSAIKWLILVSLLGVTIISCALSGVQKDTKKPRYVGSISLAEGGEVILNTEFINNSNKALCVENWPTSLDLIPIESWEDSFLVTLATGKKAQYIGPSREFVFRHPDLIRVLVVLPGKSIKSVYRLDKLYSMSSQVDSILSFMAYVECAQYDESHVIQMEPSHFLGIYEEFHDIEAFNVFMSSREPLENSPNADWAVLFVREDR